MNKSAHGYEPRGGTRADAVAPRSAPDIFIARDGAWFADGRRVVHEKIFRLFCDSLHPDGKGGHVLRIHDEECPVRVEDAPFLVKRILSARDEAGAPKLTALLSDGTFEPFAPGTLTRRGEDALYCRVRNGALRARIGRAACADIAPRLVSDESTGAYFFVLENVRFEIRDEDQPAVE
ncbi:MAG: hypothetical protein AB1742_07500 [bacterium]